MIDGVEFNWSSEDIAVPEQRAVATYLNPAGDLVIRQEGYPDEDCWIVVQREKVRSLVKAILETAGLEAA